MIAARKGDFDALLTVLDPGVVLRADRGAAPVGGATELHGAGLVAKQTLSFSKLTERAQLVTVNGGPGVLTWLPGGQPFAVLGFTVLHDKIVELYVLCRRRATGPPRPYPSLARVSASRAPGASRQPRAHDRSPRAPKGLSLESRRSGPRRDRGA